MKIVLLSFGAETAVLALKIMLGWVGDILLSVQAVRDQSQRRCGWMDGEGARVYGCSNAV